MKYPIFLLAGRDIERREIMKTHDPDEKYTSKVLLPILDKTVLEWVIEEFLKSPYVDEVFVIGLLEEDLKVEEPVHIIPTDPFSKISKKYQAALDFLKKDGRPYNMMIFCSADCPGIKVEAINQFIEYVHQNQDKEFIMAGVPEEVVREAFPDHKRGVARLTDYTLTQGELAAIKERIITEYEKIMDRFTELSLREKRSFFSTAAVLLTRPAAWPKLFKIFRGKGNLNDGIIAFSKAFKLKADAVVINDPGLALDMDLAEDYEKLKNYIKKTKV